MKKHSTKIKFSHNLFPQSPLLPLYRPRRSVKGDEFYMVEALREAEKGRGFTKTNPLVGAVIVKGKTIIARGYHAYFGGDHAERMALKRAGKRACGATLYVTLEPCSTYGKTPPCTEAIIAAGIKRVVVASYDPNPVNGKKGVRLLRRHKIQVTTGVCQKEARLQNDFFTTLIAKKRPQVILKEAQSLDGKIATYTGDSRWITSEAARTFVHTLRATVDAILVGSGTVRADDPSLTVRLVKAQKNPQRIVLNAKGDLPLSKKVFALSGKEKIITVVADSVPESRLKKYTKNGIEVIRLAHSEAGLDLKVLLSELARRNIGTLLVEGGGRLAASLLQANLVDYLYLFVAPIVIGGKEALSSCEGRGVRFIHEAIKVKNMTCQPIGPDFLFAGRVS
jgi:diaminohydroxyphosphoribosylaminopyrimidine deaminase/5-amino-6-(5-phosphoribosylamino)uracil reductase